MTAQLDKKAERKELLIDKLLTGFIRRNIGALQKYALDHD